MQCTQVWKHTNAGPHTCSCMAATVSIQAQVSARFKSSEILKFEYFSMANKRSPLLPEHRFSGLLQLTSRLTGVCISGVFVALCF